jgi:hypothetical protein
MVDDRGNLDRRELSQNLVESQSNRFIELTQHDGLYWCYIGLRSFMVDGVTSIQPISDESILRVIFSMIEAATAAECVYH